MRQIASLPGFISVCFRIAGFLLLYCICFDGPRAISQDRVIIEACKASVALVETGDRRVATAFCIDPVGIFVTNYHVVEKVEPGASVKLVMRSSETDEWSFSAEVIRFSLTNDLAILKAISIPSDKKLTSLELSRDPKIYETMDVIAFGFPFGKQLAVDKETNPSISVNVGKITAIRKENGTIELIQLDAVLNPGNSGGPVVDTTGKAVGIVSFGVLASGVNFAIPIEKLWSLIDPPLYQIGRASCRERV
jgi:S1-C subfamily serine protease